MAAELGLLSLTQLQKLAQSQQNNSVGSTWMWHPKQIQEDDDDSWEVRAFAEDTGNIMGTTWPPRSYTCTFCRREFRSAQALGGHMNVHRRDRARLHHTQPSPSSGSLAPSSLVIPAEEFARNGLCLLYPIPNPNGSAAVFSTSAMSTQTSAILSVAPYPTIGQQPVNFQVMPRGLESNTTQSYDYSHNGDSLDSNGNMNNECKESDTEELDLELRLGQRPET
ncbi:hypothetical protein ACFE04_031966 [Oxalis oulophora]